MKSNHLTCPTTHWPSMSPRTQFSRSAAGGGSQPRWNQGWPPGKRLSRWFFVQRLSNPVHWGICAIRHWLDFEFIQSRQMMPAEFIERLMQDENPQAAGSKRGRHTPIAGYISVRYNRKAGPASGNRGCLRPKIALPIFHPDRSGEQGGSAF